MAYRKQDFHGGDLKRGLTVATAEFDPEFTLKLGTWNISSGIYQGRGPRFGMSVLPGHADTEPNTGTQLNNYRLSETATGVGLMNRVDLFAIYGISFGQRNAPKSKQQTYASVVGLGGKVDVVFHGVINGSAQEWGFNIANGLTKSSYNDESPLQRKYKTEALPINLSSTATDVGNLLSYGTAKQLSNAVITVSGRDVPYRTYLADAISAGTSTFVPNGQLWTSIDIASNTPGNEFYLGKPGSINLQAIPKLQKTVTTYAINADARILIGIWTSQFNPTTANYIPSVGTPSNVIDLDFNVGATIHFTPGTGAFGDLKTLFVADSALTAPSGYKAILLACDNPIACVLQEQFTQNDGTPDQWFSLSEIALSPRVVGSQPTLNTTPPSTDFRPSCWAEIPTLGETGADTGLLEKDITYELTFSYYNKRLDSESNVGEPIRFFVSVDFTAIDLFSALDYASFMTPYGMMYAIGNQAVPWEFSKLIAGGSSSLGIIPRQFHINDYEYRFYYRALGTFEWLPCGKFDAAEFWFHPTLGPRRICQTAVSGLPGGQPGGFVDYTLIPKNKYVCVITYKNRAWWFAENSIHFSLQNNIFAYPARNSIAATSGKYRGGIVHIQSGETIQSSRLVIFSSDQTYAARFSGIRQQMPVQISFNTTANFDVDGSDLEVDFLTDATAFSYRAAVVAEGILYWWGQQGVYLDDGISKPQKISGSLESEILQFVDPSKQEQVHANYNHSTREIIWYYPPKDQDGYETHGLVANVQTSEFWQFRFKGKIDWSQNIKIENDLSNILLAGERTLIFQRENTAATIQRPYYFDVQNRSGDIRPLTDMVVKQISVLTPTTRRLTLATGFTPATLATVAVGDDLALHQVTKYATTGTVTDSICDVIAVGANFIDITVPAGATVNALGPLTKPFFFPIWIKAPSAEGVHGFSWSLRGRYWIPAGLDFYGQWLFCFMNYKLNLWPSADPQTIDLSYRTPVSGMYQTNQMTFADNSDGHFQVLTHLKIGQRSAEGQGIKLNFDGIHIGSEWILQYLNAMSCPIDGDPLMEFEG